ncbi:B12-binding domain-containing radical SAM protein [Phaeospirillum tilakii]|uniref:B12-binding domain-containing radical SAM protein n=1 Tax=Phaeospirillum tilakii TaxID=741673 RepID=A0ABW5C6P4_9PROT
MKVLLINPAFFDGDAFRNRFADYVDWIRGGNLYVAPFEPPLGLAYLTAALKREGHTVILLDMQGLMMDSEALAAALTRERPDLVGITAMTPTLPESLRVAELAKRMLPAVPVVLGGVHPTLDPAGVLADPHVDYVVRGEGEQALAGLVAALERGAGLDAVPGLCRRVGGGVRVVEKAPPVADLDLLPPADYAAFPIERYIEHNAVLRGVRGISMILSRGCPYACTFCAVQQTMGRRWRFKSPGRVVDEVIALRDAYGIEGVWFKDSIFNMRKSWTRAFCRQMVERKVGIEWQALTRIDLLDEDELVMMKAAGLSQIDLGIESGSPRSLARLDKRITVAQIRDKVAMARRHVRVFGFFMIGIPGEAEEDVRQTFDLARSIELDRWSWSIYSPLPGSKLYDDLVAEGRIQPFALDHARVHFTEAYDGVCAIPPARLKQLYAEINDHFTRRNAA